MQPSVSLGISALVINIFLCPKVSMRAGMASCGCSWQAYPGARMLRVQQWSSHLQFPAALCEPVDLAHCWDFWREEKWSWWCWSWGSGATQTASEEVLANTWRTYLSTREEEFWSYWRLFTDTPGLCTEQLLAARSENRTLRAVLQPVGMQLWVWPEQWGLQREAQAESPHQGFLLLWFWLCTVTPCHLFPLEFGLGLSVSQQELQELMLQQDQWPGAEVSMWWAGIQLPAHPHKPLRIPPWSHSIVLGSSGQQQLCTAWQAATAA